jgi:hypothetical protein
MATLFWLAAVWQTWQSAAGGPPSGHLSLRPRAKRHSDYNACRINVFRHTGRGSGKGPENGP